MQAVARGGVGANGTRLPFAARLQDSFGHHDLSGVTAHVGGASTSASRQLGARAYAFGESIAFSSAPDLRTAAHEAAHVIQQRSHMRLANGLGKTNDIHERHADRVANRVIRGLSAESLLNQYRPGAPSRSVAAQLQLLPAISAWAVNASNGSTTEPDNCARIAPRNLGVDPNPSEFENAIELKAIIRGHESGYSYDIKRTKEKKTWAGSSLPLVGLVWTLRSSAAAGSDDDRRNYDECLTPSRHDTQHKIYSFDGPGFAPGSPSGNSRYDAYCQAMNFREFVRITKPDGSSYDDANVRTWHSKLVLHKENRSWSVDTANSTVGTGHLSSLDHP